MAIIQTVIQGGGTTPTGTLQITTNGTHDVTNYATADVQVPTTAPTIYAEKINDNGTLKNKILVADFTGVTTIPEFTLCGVMNKAVGNLTTLDMSSITSINGTMACARMCRVVPSLTSVNLSNLQSIWGNQACYSMFQNTGITGVLDLNNLQSINGYSTLSQAAGENPATYMFWGCTGITGIKLDFLSDVQNGGQCVSYMFGNCTGITTVSLPSIDRPLDANSLRYMFYGCTNLTDLYMPYFYSTGYPTGVNNMLDGITGCKVHLPSNKSSALSSLNFGGTNTQLVFDQPAWLRITGVNNKYYIPSPAYNTETARAWHETNQYWNVGGYKTLTTFYTSGLTDPQVGDTIYSDSACTTAVTTISAIA